MEDIAWKRDLWDISPMTMTLQVLLEYQRFSGTRRGDVLVQREL